jgi:hypothetical protein
MRTIRHLLLYGLAAVAIGAAACSDAGTPVSPSPAVTETTPQDGARTLVGLTGIIQDLNVRAQTFTLVARPQSRTIRADAETQVWRDGSRIRFSTLQNGMNAGVRGTDEGRYVRAITVGVLR